MKERDIKQFHAEQIESRKLTAENAKKVLDVLEAAGYAGRVTSYTPLEVKIFPRETVLEKIKKGIY